MLNKPIGKIESISSLVRLSPRAARRILYSRLWSTCLVDYECTLGICLGICSATPVIAREGGGGRVGASGASPSPIGIAASSRRC